MRKIAGAFAYDRIVFCILRSVFTVGVSVLCLYSSVHAKAISFVNAFDALMQQHPGYCLTNDRVDDGIGTFSDGDSYILEAYTRMYELTRRAPYLDNAIELAQCIVARRGWLYGRFESERYRYGWPNKPGYALVDTAITAYGTGMITRGLAGLVLAIAQDDSLATTDAYKKTAEGLLSAIVDAIAVHDGEWRFPITADSQPRRSSGPLPDSIGNQDVGAYVFREGDAYPAHDSPLRPDGKHQPLIWYCQIPLPLNQLAAIGRALAVTARILELRPNWLPGRYNTEELRETYRFRALAIAAFIRRDLIERDGILYWNYWSRFYRTSDAGNKIHFGAGDHTEAEACSRKEFSDVRNNRADDLAHGHLVSAFILDVKLLDNDVFTEDVLSKIAHAIPERIDAGYDIRTDSGAVRDLLDGTPDIPKRDSYNRYRTVIGLWLILAKYDPRVVQIAFRAHYPELSRMRGWSYLPKNPEITFPGWFRLILALFAELAATDGFTTKNLWLSEEVADFSPLPGVFVRKIRWAGISVSQSTDDGVLNLTVVAKQPWRPRKTTVVSATANAITAHVQIKTVRLKKKWFKPRRTLIGDFDCDGNVDLLVAPRRGRHDLKLVPSLASNSEAAFDYALSSLIESDRRLELLNVLTPVNGNCSSAVLAARSAKHDDQIISVHFELTMDRKIQMTEVVRTPRSKESGSFDTVCSQAPELLVAIAFARNAGNEYRPIAAAYQLPKRGHEHGLTMIHYGESCTHFRIGVGEGVCPQFGSRRKCRLDPEQKIHPAVLSTADRSPFIFADHAEGRLWIRIRSRVDPW